MTKKSPNSPSTQKNIRAQNQACILRAAETKFVKQGFKGTTMQAIADRAGLPKANVHYYFKNKKNLYNQLLKHIVMGWSVGLADITPDSDPETALRTFIQDKLKQTFANKNQAKLFALEIIHGAPHFGDFIHKEVKEWADEKVAVMQSWVDAGKLNVRDPLQLLIWIWATTQRYAEFEMEILALKGQKQYTQTDIHRVSNDVETFILRGCGLLN